MKKKSIVMLCVVFVLIMGACTAILAWDDVVDKITSRLATQDGVVDYEVRKNNLKVDVSDIPVKDKRQMLSVSLVFIDADVSKPSKEQILYANSWYVNGRESMEINVPNTAMDLSQYRLVVSDTTKSILYSMPIGTTDDIYLNVTNGDTYVITSDKTNVKLNGQNYTGGEISTVGEHIFSYDVQSGNYERCLVAYRDGDANVDNQVDIVDVVREKKYIDNQTQVSNNAERMSSDLNKDGKLDSEDIKLLRKLILN